MDFRRTTIADLAADVRSGRTRARDLVEVALARIEEVDQRVNAFVAVDADGAREQADAVDARVAAGEDVGPLAGIPLGVKDLEDAAGFRATQGSAAHADAGPAAADTPPETGRAPV